MTKKLTDREIYDLLYQALLLIKEKRGETSLGDGALTTIRTLLDSTMQALVYKELGLDLVSDDEDEFKNLTVRMPEECYEYLVRFTKECSNVSSEQQAVVFIIGHFFKQIGYRD